MEPRNILLALSIQNNFDWEKTFLAIKNKEEVKDETWEEFDSYQCDFITILDENYPERFKKLYQPPFVIFYDGNIDLLKPVDFYPNPYIFLYGENRFNIPQTNLCVFTEDGKIDIAGGLKIWTKDYDDPSRFIMPARICNSIACCNRYSKEKGPKTKFGSITVPFALTFGCDIYMIPTSGPSFNNDLINDGAFLLDSSDKIKVLQKTLPF